MRFSILIPVYNAEKYLADCLDSVIMQSYPDYEIILVDDGSKDSSAEIIGEYQNRYSAVIQYVRQENSGQLAARCHAIALAKGDYCLFLDADDRFAENAFQIIDEHLRMHDDPDMMFFPFYYDLPSGMKKSKFLRDDEHLYEGDDLHLIYREAMEGILLNSVCTKAVKTDIAKKSTEGYEPYTSLRCSEDRYQSLMMLCYVQRVLYVPIGFYYYRQTEGSTTRSYSYEKIQRFNTVLMYDIEKSCLKKWNMDTLECRRRFDAKWAKYPLYVMDLFFFHVVRQERDMLLHCSWKDFLPKELTLESIQENPDLDQLTKKMWRWIDSEDMIKLKWHFMKKSMYKGLRKLKRNIFG